MLQSLLRYILLSAFVVECWSHNLSCYQCTRYDNQECAAGDLVPCMSNFDRCVTHVERDGRRGYMIKRECGLGPCAFEDDMVNKGLGFNACDRSKEEFFCVSCCRTSGCNKSSASLRQLSNLVLTISFVFSGFRLIN